MKGGVSARQLAVAAFTGLLSPVAAAAGMDWRGALLALPVLLPIARCWERQGRDADGWTAVRKGGAGRVLAALYLVWSALSAAIVLAYAGVRMAAPDGRDAGWVILLIWLPVLLLARKGTSAYGRAAGIFYWAMLTALVFVLVLGGRQIRAERLLSGPEGLVASFISALGIGCTGGSVLLLWRGDKEGAGPGWMPWTLLLGGASLLMRAVTAGVLGTALARSQARPFFLVTVGLGQTARVEGLVAAVWLLADITLAGLMLQCGKCLWSGMGLRETNGTWVAALVVLGMALLLNRMGNVEFWIQTVLPGMGLVFGGGVPALSCLLHRRNGDALERKSEESQGKGESKKR